MNTNQVIEGMKKEAKENEAANAVLHAWALRKRARNQVTIHALMQSMRAEGFEYGAKDYSHLLQTMANLGFGKIETDGKGKVKALKDIKVKLQSLGQAVVGKESSVSHFKPRNRFSPIAQPLKAVPLDEVVAAVQLTLSVNGKPVNINIPANLTAEEIAGLISKLQGRSDT